MDEKVLYKIILFKKDRMKFHDEEWLKLKNIAFYFKNQHLPLANITELIQSDSLDYYS